MKIAKPRRIAISGLALACAMVVPVHAQAAGAANAGGTAIAQSAAQPITIRVGQLIDGKGGVRKNVLVTVEGSKIRRIAGAEGAARATYDFQALTLMPGMIDTHVHIDSHFGKDGRIANPLEEPATRILYAYENVYKDFMGGFTTLQGLTSPSIGSPSDIELRDAIARGDMPGPRIVASIGLINEKSGTPEEIRQKVRDSAARGADVIKLFASKSIREHGTITMSDEQIAAACQEAKALGKRSWVHAHSAESVRAAVNGGCDAIAHGAFATEEEFRMMAERGVFFEPDIALNGLNYLANQQRFLGTSNYTPEGFKLQEQAMSLKLAMYRGAIRQKGLKIPFGTDATAGCHGRLAEEIVYRVQTAGQPAIEALTQATSLSAEAIRLDDQIGSIKEGMEADLIVLDGDPLKDITAVNRVVFVMKGGKVYKNQASRKVG